MGHTGMAERVAALAGLLLAGAAMPGRAQDARAAPERRIEFVRLEGHGAHERRWSRGDYAVRSEAQWLEVWAQGHGEPDSRIERLGGGRPIVEFERFMLAGVSRGQQGHGCSSLFIDEVVEHADGIELRFVYPGVDDHLPGQPFKVCTAVVVNLVDWVLLPWSAKPMRFVRVAK